MTAKEYQLRNVPMDYRLVPGMSLTGDILVGTRSIWPYMTEGAMRARTGSDAWRLETTQLKLVAKQPMNLHHLKMYFPRSSVARTLSVVVSHFGS